MSDLENTSPIMDNPGENPVNPNDLEADLQNPMPEEQQSPDFSELFSENISGNTPIQEEPIQEQSVPSSETTYSQENSEEITKTPEPINQDDEVLVSETNFDQVIEHTALDNNPQNVQTAQPTATELQKAAIEQQKLLLLKQKEADTKKAKRSWFTTWILTGILITLLLFVAGVIFAKDYILSAIDYIDSLMPSSITGITTDTQQNYPILDNTDISEEALGRFEEISCDVEERCLAQLNRLWEQKHELTCVYTEQDSQEYFIEWNILSKSPTVNILTTSWETYLWWQDYWDNSWVTQENKWWNIVYIQLSNLSKVIKLWTKITCAPWITDKTIFNLPTDIKFVAQEELEEELDKHTEERNKEKYTITHVSFEEEANWVLPSHCSDLTCYGEEEEFVACTSFKMIETLDENTPRVSSRWGCKYKDPSELVYVEFSDNHKSANTQVISHLSTPEFTIIPTSKWKYPSEFILTVNNSDDKDSLKYSRKFSTENYKIISSNNDYKTIIVQFDKVGNHTIELKVTDKNWEFATTSKTIEVQSTLRPEIEATPNAIIRWKEINFKATINNLNDVVNYVWDFWDGKSFDSQYAINVTHIYWKKWIYTVKLTVYNKDWNSNTTTQQVFIGEVDEPIAAYNVKDSNWYLINPTEKCNITTNESWIYTYDNAYSIDKNTLFSINPSISVNANGYYNGLQYVFKPDAETQSVLLEELNYNFNYPGCHYIDLTVQDLNTNKQDKTTIRFLVN